MRSSGELAKLVSAMVGFSGRLEFDATKPDGTPRKLLDVGKMAALGRSPRVQLREGIESTYRWFVDHSGGCRNG